MTQQEFQTRYKYNPSTDCIGEGGFGKVYKAYDTHLDKWVAIKVAEVKPGLEQVRLKKEVEIVSKLPTHPNIANYEACYTFSSFTGEFDFAVLQYYEEGNLQQLIDSGKLNQTQKEALLRQILDGIGFLHNQDIIHRDLKPQNILIAKRNDEYITKITDFGISKKLDFNNSSVFTNSLAGAGTMAYASPEQLLGKTIKKNTDLWSFGVIVCQVFTGKLPFSVGRDGINSEAGRIELYKQIVNGTVSFSANSIPVKWQQLIKQCIVVDNNLRATKAEICFGIINKNFFDNTDLEYNINEFDIVVENGFCGFSDYRGKRITPIKYKLVKLFSEGMAVVGINEKYGFIDSCGREIVRLKYDNVLSYSDGMAVVGFVDEYDNDDKFGVIKYKYGYIDKQGNETVPIKYSSARSFSDGLALVSLNGKFGFIDKEGKVIIPLKYNDAYSFSDGFAAVKINNKWAIIDKEGNEIIPFIYDNIYPFSDGLACVRIKGKEEYEDKYGFINKSGKVIIPLIYSDAHSFSEELALVGLNRKKYFIDKQGNIIINLKYDHVDSFSGGLARVNTIKYGFIDKQGNEIIPLKFHFADSFSEGLACVENFNKGFIDKQGREIIPLDFQHASSFSEGLANVTLNGKFGCINKKGEFFET